MKKTFTINISGTIFHIEDDAYEVLQKYLVNLKNHFGIDDEGKEIIADIEARIAEIFNEKSTVEKKVVTMEWVNEVVGIMGTPEDFAEEESGEDPVIEKQKRKRSLYRDPDRRVLGGVCGGLGAYFNMDPVILRIIFAVLFLITSGAALLAYLILWIAVPKATNTAQRLEMRGQEATVKNIEKSIKEEVSEVKESYKKFKESDTYSKGKKSMEGAGDVVYNVFKVILKIFVIIIGIVLLISGFFGLLGLISSMVIGQSFVDGWPLIWGPEIHFPNVLNHFVEPGTVTFGLISVGFLAGIPLLALLFIGSKLVFRYKSNNAAIVLSMLGVWFIALIALVTVSASQVGNYKSRSSITNSETISCDSCQTLYLELAEDKYKEYFETDWDLDNFKVVVVDGEEVMLGQPRLDVEKSSSEDFVITIKNSSRGRTREDAKESTDYIAYHYSIDDSTLSFDPFFILEEDGKWRNQEVDITVKVPEGKAIYLGEELVKIIHDIENVSNTWDGDMVGEFWEMKIEGLTKKEIAE
ncbi:MAG: PspC domain-containing protein [Prolixibacteraceae bacterium]|jgi:phage shock protein PspC (stress-responsive transcriptional regulator)|nr:PspC domain-containing protein [Prolixibacteraceae bacterium]MBT6763446.1 PspC domain-containing protein [Prolixibacteraceae bacterium]MBT6999186.1 PspC domain-containing protein [Prolixibacteraceae bacterium]MBT7396538.1 PspC domain-containing protein [Prolixibacteraceae bacterium]